jgi:hypothetical protein
MTTREDHRAVHSPQSKYLRSLFYLERHKCSRSSKEIDAEDDVVSNCRSWHELYNWNSEIEIINLLQ